MISEFHEPLAEIFEYTDATDEDAADGERAPPPTPLLLDNRGALYIASTMESRRVKHVRLRHAKLREEFAAGRLEGRWVPTIEQIADLFTKPLGTQVFKKLLDLLDNFDAATAY